MCQKLCRLFFSILKDIWRCFGPPTECHVCGTIIEYLLWTRWHDDSFWIMCFDSCCTWQSTSGKKLYFSRKVQNFKPKTHIKRYHIRLHYMLLQSPCEIALLKNLYAESQLAVNGERLEELFTTQVGNRHGDLICPLVFLSLLENDESKQQTVMQVSV